MTNHIDIYKNQYSIEELKEILNGTISQTAILLNQSMRDVTEGYIQRILEIKRNNLEKIEKLMLGHLHGWIKVHWYDGDKKWCINLEPDDNAKKEAYYF